MNEKTATLLNKAGVKNKYLRMREMKKKYNSLPWNKRRKFKDRLIGELEK